MVIWVDGEVGKCTQLLFVYKRIMRDIAGIGDDDDDNIVSNLIFM